MTTEFFVELLSRWGVPTACVGALAAVAVFIVRCVKKYLERFICENDIRKIKEESEKTTAMVRRVLEENVELKKQNRELKEVITRVRSDK